MVDPGTIISLLAAGAIAKVEGLGGQVVADAYAGLKRIITDVYGFAAGGLLEKKPKDEATLKVAAEDLAAAATTDPEVEEKVRELEEALAAISQERWAKVGVVIEGLTAGRDVALGNVTAGRRGVVIRFLRAEKGDIKIGSVSG